MKPPSISSPPDALLGVAVEHATAQVPVAHRRQRVGEVRAKLAGRQFDCAEDIAVLESDTLVGLVSIERLLAADSNASVEEIMDADPPRVAPDTDQERAARSMVERHECSLAVVDADGRFLGLIPPYRMLAVLLDEHDEDLARLGGFLAGTTRAQRRRGAGRATPLAPAALVARRPARGDGRDRDRRGLRASARGQCPPRLLHPRRRLHGGCGRHPH